MPAPTAPSGKAEETNLSDEIRPLRTNRGSNPRAPIGLQDTDSKSVDGPFLASGKARAGDEPVVKIPDSATFLPPLTPVRPLLLPVLPSSSCIENPGHRSTALVRHSPGSGNQVASREESAQGSSSSRTSFVDGYRITSFQSTSHPPHQSRTNKERLLNEALTWPELYQQLKGDKKRLEALIQNFDQEDEHVPRGDIWKEWLTYERIAKNGKRLEPKPFLVYSGPKFHRLNRLKLWLTFNMHMNPDSTWPPHYKSPRELRVSTGWSTVRSTVQSPGASNDS